MRVALIVSFDGDEATGRTGGQRRGRRARALARERLVGHVPQHRVRVGHHCAAVARRLGTLHVAAQVAHPALPAHRLPEPGGQR